MRPTELQKLWMAVVFSHVAAIVGLIFWWDPHWLILAFVAHVAYLWLGHDLYYHRFLAHQSFAMPVCLQRVSALLGVFCLFGTPIGIAATHVRHHRYSDTDNDPHPAKYGWQAWCWVYPGMKIKDKATVIRLSKDTWLRSIGKHYFYIYFGSVLIAGIVDPRLAIYGFFVPATYAFFSNGLVNVICHRWGYRRYKSTDDSKNNLFVNAFLFFSGIALHNTHHSNPKDYRLTRSWYELDLVGWIAHGIHTVTSKKL